MRVLMFGWEFPPLSSGGLGTACYGLTKSLSQKKVEIVFVIPKASEPISSEHLKMLVADDLATVDVKEIDSLLVPYISSETYSGRLYQMLKQYSSSKKHDMYGMNLFDEVRRYAEKAKLIAKFEDFDLIHTHDWMTFKAGIAAKKMSGKPLIVHVHATEFDRTGGHPNQAVYDIEREGMHAADKIIAVSNFTKNKIVEHYGISADKVFVVHNAVQHEITYVPESPRTSNKEKIVLFLGRITLQKGPDYFLDAAKKVLEKDSNVKFIVAGSGDMEPFIIEKAAHLGISDKVLFAGFLNGPNIDKAYQMADLYVMPSVSEPFGITPLEALKNDTPVIISKQSGVSEVLKNALKVDFWDIDELANKILAVLKYQSLHHSLREEGSKEVKSFSWDNSADKCIEVYSKVLGAT